MKLYVFSKVNNSKVYLNVTFPHRQAMRNYFGGEWFTINDNNSYHVGEVYAEAEKKTGTVAGTLIGGLVGLLAGPEGAIIGAAIGAAIGNSSDKDETPMVNAFNNSY